MAEPGEPGDGVEEDEPRREPEHHERHHQRLPTQRILPAVLRTEKGSGDADAVALDAPDDAEEAAHEEEEAAPEPRPHRPVQTLLLDHQGPQHDQPRPAARQHDTSTDQMRAESKRPLRIPAVAAEARQQPLPIAIAPALPQASRSKLGWEGMGYPLTVHNYLGSDLT